MSYSVCNLYSGSKGNATVIRAGGKTILIDAGKSARILCCALNSVGVSPESIDAIFITHEHTDHVSALQTYSHKYNTPIHILLSSAKKKFYGLRDEKLFSNMVFHDKPNFEVNIGEVTVSSFPTPHDSCGSVGYKISFMDNEKKISIGIATDIGCVTDEMRDNLLGCESVILESNHDKEMLHKGPYPYELKQRIASKHGHLSNCECAALCATLTQNGTKSIMLAHLSEECNLPEIAYNECLMAVADPGVRICVASPTTPIWLCKSEE